MSDAVDFSLPNAIKDYVFDLAEATRMAMRSEDVSQLYDTKFKELTEKFFSQSAWPDAKAIAPECNHDEVFLLFYKEMTVRHLFTKLKPQLSHFLESWSNYNKLFEFVLASPEPSIVLTLQWVNDIIQEFVYQFQGFCQYRCQVASRSTDELKVLQANRSVWSLPSILRVLKGLVRASIGDRVSELHAQFGSFAAVEMARLECLLGDYTASLQALSTLNLNDRSAIFMQLPTCQVTVFYHAGISHLMLRRYADAIETFSDVILHISRILKPGAGTMARSVQAVLQKILDKILAMTAIAVALCPGYRVDDQVRELVEGKWAEKLRRMNAGDVQAFVDLFEQTCPKFISPIVPDYSVAVNMGQDAFGNQVSVLAAEVMQQIAVLKIRSYMRLYASIDISKLARFADVSEPAFISQLVSYRHKTMEVQHAPVGDDAAARRAKDGPSTARASTSDVHYHIQDGALVIDTSAHKSDKSRAVERYFAAGVRKHAEIVSDLNRAFARAGV